MSVTSVNVRSIEGGESGSGSVTTYTVHYVVVTDDPLDGVAVILADSNIPNIADTYAPTANESDTNAVCVSVDPIPRRTTRTVWDVRVEYTTNPGAADFGEASNPLLRPVKVSYGGAKYRELAQKDADNVLITNSAGDLLPPEERDRTRTVIRLVKNLDFQQFAHLEYQDSVNSDVFLGQFQPKTCKMDNVAISEQLQENGVNYYQHLYEVHYDRNGWRRPIPDRGLRAKNPNAADAVMNILDARGEKTRIFHPLDGKGYVTGTAVADGGSGNTDVLLAGGGVPITGALDGVKMYEEKPFGPLGLL